MEVPSLPSAANARTANTEDMKAKVTMAASAAGVVRLRIAWKIDAEVAAQFNAVAADTVNTAACRDTSQKYEARTPLMPSVETTRANLTRCSPPSSFTWAIRPQWEIANTNAFATKNVKNQGACPR